MTGLNTFPKVLTWIDKRNIKNGFLPTLLVEHRLIQERQYRRTIGRLPAVRRLGLLDSSKPVKGIVLTGWQGALDAGPFFDEIIAPLNIGDVPVELH
jgi:hypothetical protein